MAQHSDDSTGVIVGRMSERTALRELVAAVRAGEGRVLVIRGDPGIGKTALLDDLAAAQPDLTMERLVGAEAEARLAFAGVQRLVLRHKAFVDGLPAPQRHALGVTIGVDTGPPPDRFLVGVGMHSLLSAVSASRPLLILVDDVQWLDQESIDVLAFVARRLDHDGIGMILAQRSDNAVHAFDQLDTLHISGLARSAALTLLRRVVTRPLELRISDQIITATDGNPLAIIDLAQELSTHQLVGLTLLPEPMPVGSHLQAHYLRQLQALPRDTQTWLLLAAAEPSGDPAYVAAAVAVLGIDVDAGDLAEARNLVRTGERILFRHPLVRSAIYSGATAGQRRRIHTALAAVTRRATDVDRRAWHLASGCVGPDESVADALEQAGERARERGGYSARASLLARAVELSPDGPHRVQRTLAAAAAAMTAGRAVQTLALLDALETAELDEMQRGRALMIRASIQGFTGQLGAMATIPAICVAAADAFAPQAPELAREALITAFERSLGAEWMMTGTTVVDLADRARRLISPARTGVDDLLLLALAALATTPFPAAAEDIRPAIDALRADDLPDDRLLRFAWTSVALTTALWDDGARTEILARAIDVARSTGALHTLDALLFIQSLCETVLGQLESAGRHLTELREVRHALGMSPAQQEMFRNIEYLAWLGDGGDPDGLLDSIESSRQASMALGLGGAETLGRTALMLVQLSTGNDEAAYQIARHNRDLNFLQISIRVLPDLVETAARTGRPTEALIALQELREVAIGSGTHWGLGVLEKSAALCAAEQDAEAHYQAAIEHLSNCRARADLARSHLLYGEWLRRRKRRKQAGVQLRAALEHFEDMGATGFAGRARRELAATGERAGRSADAGETSWGETALTPQEAAVAHLAAQGATNAEIAATLTISQHTVDYHLRKVFRKLGMSSRRALRRRHGHSAMSG